MLIIPDATKDFRFHNHPAVIGEPHVRFYAGCPLLCPEGFKLGTLCIVDTVPRPQGLSDDQKQTLKDLADMVIKVMVDRRYQLEQKQQEEEEAAALQRDRPAQTVAQAVEELMAPLSGLQLSLGLLKEDTDMQGKLDEQQSELLETALNCSELMSRICEKNKGASS